MTTTSYEIERVHDIFIPTIPAKAVSTERCSDDDCQFNHYYAVYERLGAPGYQAVWVADYETLEDAQEAVETETFHICDDECRSAGCTQRLK